jgi:hypothetical protein
MAASRGLVKKSGSWYAWERANGSSLRGQGMEAFKEQILNAEALPELREIALSALAANPDAPEGIGDDFEEEDEATMREVLGILNSGKPKAVAVEEEE